MAINKTIWSAYVVLMYVYFDQCILLPQCLYMFTIFSTKSLRFYFSQYQLISNENPCDSDQDQAVSEEPVPPRVFRNMAIPCPETVTLPVLTSTLNRRVTYFELEASGVNA